MSPSLTLLVLAAVAQADPMPESLYQTLVSADHWRQQAEAVHALGDLGEAGLPFLINGTQHDSEKVQDWCYREVFKKFADHPETTQAVLRGLESEHARTRYACCFFAGTQKIESAKEKLREIYSEPKSELRLKFLQVTCGIGLAVTLMLAVSTFWINAYDHHLSLTDEFHVGVDNYSPWVQPRLIFFNNTDSGPYRGSLIGLSDGHGGIVGGPLQMRYFGDTAGIYYRWLLRPEGVIWWTLMVSLWYPTAFFAAFLVWWRMRLTQQARSDSNCSPAKD